MLYVDGKLKLYAGAAEQLLHTQLLSRSPTPIWVSPPHPKRRTPFEEAMCLRLIGKVPLTPLSAQLRAYRAEGFPIDKSISEFDF